MDATRILLEIRNEQERQRHDLAAIKQTLGVLGGRKEINRRVEVEKQNRRQHDTRGLKMLKRFRSGGGDNPSAEGGEHQ